MVIRFDSIRLTNHQIESPARARPVAARRRRRPLALRRLVVGVVRQRERRAAQSNHLIKSISIGTIESINYRPAERGRPAGRVAVAHSGLNGILLPIFDKLFHNLLKWNLLIGGGVFCLDAAQRRLHISVCIFGISGKSIN